MPSINIALPASEAHQAADRAEFAERHQRAEVVIDERLQRLPVQGGA